MLVIFVVVGGLLAYSAIKFRGRAADAYREPPQVYGSTQIELAWTVIPVLVVIVLFLAIGLVSWLTMARVVRGQVLSLRAQPFIEACKATGIGEWRIFTRHLLPNLVGPITVYATLTVPVAQRGSGAPLVVPLSVNV